MKYLVGEVCLDQVTQQTIIYPNKTRKYLLPCLREYGETFTNMFNNVFKVAVGLGDIVIDNRGQRIYERHLFILVDSFKARPYFLEFMKWIRNQTMYEDDYIYGNITKSNLYMIILKFPEKHYKSFKVFIEGKYSHMFTPELIEKFFVGDDHAGTRKILIKDKEYKIIFTKRLNRIFNSQLRPEDWDGELDLPLQEHEEYFNYHLKQ